MISLTVYKALHLLGVLFTVASLTGMAVHAANGGTRAGSRTRTMTTALHGTGLLLVLVAGFGMLARLGLTAATGWVLAKLGIWLVLGIAVFVPYRRPQLARPLFLTAPLLAALAGLLALAKPL